MGKYKISIEYIEDTKNKPVLDFTPVMVAEFTINGEARADEVIEHFLKLMQVMGWSMEHYLEELDDYLDRVDKRVEETFNFSSMDKREE